MGGELHFTGESIEACSRVAVGERAPSSVGHHTILQTALSYNPTTNAQYWDGDCLYIRVKELYKNHIWSMLFQPGTPI